MLMSASTCERLSEEGLFKDSAVTPAIRLNDTTDIWSARGGRYKEEPSRHHRTARLDQAKKHVDLGLYSITFSNQRDIDAENAEAYSAFRAEAATHKHAALPGGVQSGLRHPPDRWRRDRLISSTTTSCARSPA